MESKHTKEKRLADRILAIGCEKLINSSNINKYFKNICMNSDELYEHSLNVAILSVLIGAYVFSDKDDMQGLFVSGLLHDYGKLLIRKEILNKSECLTMSERKEIEEHPLKGYNCLKKDKSFSEETLKGILQHHERVDGCGYGQGLHEEDISMFAKIIMIADVYDAMISDRIYHSRIERGIVYEFLFGNAGKYFSRPLIKYFINTTLSINLEYMLRQVKEHVLVGSDYRILKVGL